MRKMKWLCSMLFWVATVGTSLGETVFLEDMSDVGEWVGAQAALTPNGDGTAVLSTAVGQLYGKVECHAGVFSVNQHRYLEVKCRSVASGARFKVQLVTGARVLTAIEEGIFADDYVIDLTANPQFEGLNGDDFSVVIWIEGTQLPVEFDEISIRTEAKRHVYVSPLGTDQAPYLMWATAAHSIQAAVEQAGPNGVVEVARGVYTISEPIVLEHGVVVRSADGQPEFTIVDGGGETGCFVLSGNGGGESGNPVLDGFTVRNGYAISGAGISCYNGGLVTNCIITDNIGRLDFVGDTHTGDKAGGGVCFRYPGGMIKNCVIKNNFCFEGGGIACIGGGRVIDCTIVSNSSRRGGGVFFWQTTDPGPLMQRCVISWNSAPEGGGVCCIPGVYSHLSECIISHNGGWKGGGLYLFGTRIENSLISHNISSLEAGGVYFRNGELIGCTVVSNVCTGAGEYTYPGKVNIFLPKQYDQNVEAPAGGAFLYAVTVKNSIIYDNRANGLADNYSYGPVSSPSSMSFYHCCTEPRPAIAGLDTLTDPPQFVDALNENYALASESPCIDSGTSEGMISDTDLAGIQRPLDGDLTDGVQYDMGAYEFFVLSGDADSDGLSNEEEINTHHTNPFRADTDGDTLSDWDEVVTYDTNPVLADEDGDGFNDREEIFERKTDPRRYNGRVYAHFMPWYGDNNEYQQLSAHDGLNDQLPHADAYHWRDGYTTNGGPIIGEYSSRDEDVCEYHLLAAIASELDGFIINWRGTNGLPAFLDDGAWMMFDKLRDLRARFGGQANYFTLCSLNYDDFPYQNLEDFSRAAVSNDLAYLKETFVSPFQNEYLHVWSGEKYRPFVSVFLSWDDGLNRAGVVYTAALDNVLSAHIAWPTPDSRTERYVNSYYAWVQPDGATWAEDGSDWGRSYLENDFYGRISSFFNSKTITMGGVWPGFDDRYVNWYGPQPIPYGQKGNRWMDRQGVGVFNGTWALANEGFEHTPPVKLIQVITWNDWNEGTSIEPSGDGSDGAYGYLYVDHLRTNAALFRSRTVMNDQQGVRLAREIYFARKKFPDTASQTTVDNAVREFLRADYVAAAAELAKLDALPIQYQMPTWEDGFDLDNAAPYWARDNNATAFQSGGQFHVAANSDGWGGVTSPELLVDLDRCPNLTIKLDSYYGEGESKAFLVKVHSFNSSDPGIELLRTTAPGIYTMNIRQITGWTGKRLIDIQFYVVNSTTATGADLDYVKITP
jgi:hypothetical protein